MNKDEHFNTENIKNMKNIINPKRFPYPIVLLFFHDRWHHPIPTFVPPTCLSSVSLRFPRLPTAWLYAPENLDLYRSGIKKFKKRENETVVSKVVVAVVVIAAAVAAAAAAVAPEAPVTPTATPTAAPTATSTTTPTRPTFFVFHVVFFVTVIILSLLASNLTLYFGRGLAAFLFLFLVVKDHDRRGIFFLATFLGHFRSVPPFFFIRLSQLLVQFNALLLALFQ